LLKKLTKRNHPGMLTIEGRTATAAQDAAEAIREGLDDIDHGRTRPAEVFDDIRRKYAMPRSDERSHRP
jgi:hypothetical protein